MTPYILPSPSRFISSVALALFLVLASCVAPRPVSRLTPHAGEGYFQLGREFITLHNDGVYVIAAFEENRDEDLVFDVIVMNKSDRTIEVDPERFYALRLKEPAADSSHHPPLAAIHPENVLLNIDRSRAVEYAEKRTNVIWGVLEATAGVVSTVSAVASDAGPAHVAEEAAYTFETMGFHLARDAEIRDHMRLINDDKLYWKNDVLRKNTLAPGTAVEGFVYFPRDTDASWYMMCYPMGDQLFQFVYRQRLYY